MDHVLQHDLVQGQVRDEAFELQHFVAQLLQLTDLARLEPAIDLLPAVKALLRDSYLSAEIADRNPLLRLVLHRTDLLGRESLLFHGTPPGPSGLIVPQLSLTDWSEKAGAPQCRGNRRETSRVDVLSTMGGMRKIDAPVHISPSLSFQKAT